MSFSDHICDYALTCFFLHRSPWKCFYFYTSLSLFIITVVIGYTRKCLGGVVVSVSDSWSRVHGFDSHVPLSPSSTKYNLVLVKGRWCSAAGKVTVGLASHWPCITDFSGLSTYGLTATEREMSTPCAPTLGHGTLYLIVTVWSVAYVWYNSDGVYIRDRRCKLLTAVTRLLTCELYARVNYCRLAHALLWL